MKNKSENKGLTPMKQKTRPGGGNPSPVKPFKISGVRKTQGK